jgi:Zn-dependent protease
MHAQRSPFRHDPLPRPLVKRAPIFYSIDSRAVTLREYWWGARSPAILVAALLKFLRVKLPGATDDPSVETLSPFEVEETAVPEADRQVLAPRIEELEAQGFHSPLCHVIQDDLNQVETLLVTLLHESGQAWARVHRRLWRAQVPAREVVFVEIVTAFDDRTFLWSLSSKPDLAAPPSCVVVRRTGATPRELWASHQASLATESARRRVTPVRTVDEMRGSVERLHSSVRNFHLRRGVFRLTSADERRQALANGERRKNATAQGSPYPQVMAEIGRLQDRKSSWQSAVLVLLASMVLFVGVAPLRGGKLGVASLGGLAILLPVLLFHEAGHWIAMRLFGYRNLKMFFIPMVGAAVSGRHYNVAGWKKAVVSLMGPVPGIVAGSILGVVGLLTHQMLLLRAALTALVLNGFNLLPVLPLDGGWVIQAMLASRSPVFEVIFRGVAVLALGGASVLTGDRLLLYLAVFMLMGLPGSAKLARITRELRRGGLETVSPDDQSIPAPVCAAIVEKVLAAFPRRAPNRVVAERTLHVFESLNARPPGLAACLGLLFVQGASLVGALVFAVLVGVGLKGGLSGVLQAAQATPPHTLETSRIQVWRSEPNVTGGPHNTVVATFRSAAASAEAIRGLRPASASGSAVQVFGPSVLVALPAADEAGRKQWLAALQAKASDVFVATPQMPGTFRLACQASSSDAASSIEQEAHDYLIAGAAMRLVPPWQENDTKTDAERSAHARVGPETPKPSEEMSPLLGRFPGTDEVGAPGMASPTSARGGVLRHDLLITMPYLQFGSLFEGPPAVVHWLQSRGCTDFRYEFKSGLPADSEDGEENTER